MKYVGEIIKRTRDYRAPDRYVYDIPEGAIVLGGNVWMGELEVLVPIHIFYEMHGPPEEPDEEQ